MSTSRNKTLPTWGADLLFLTSIFVCLFFTMLGSRPLFVPDEGRYAEIAREMLQSGDFITPTLNGVQYFEKPVLFYWLSSMAFKFLGVKVASIRFVNALLGLLCCLATYAIARKLYGRRTAYYAALILSLSLLFFAMTHMVSLDLSVTFFITLSLYALLLAYDSSHQKTRFLYLCAASICSALAMLTKGLIGIFFPLLIFGCFILLKKEWHQIKKLHVITLITLFLIIVIPWHLLAQLRHPEFFHFYFIEQHFLRYTDLNIGHYQPVWFFIPCLLLGFMPWTVFLPQTLFSLVKEKMDPKKFSYALFFILWASLVFGFFSFSKSKLIPYILPIIPPLAILTAQYLAKPNLHRKGIQIGYLFMIGVCIAFASLIYFFLRNSPMPDPVKASAILKTTITLFSAGTLLAALISFFNIKKAIIVTFVSTGIFSISLLSVMPAIDTRTVQPFASYLKPILLPTDEVVAFNQYYQDLPFYLERRITVVDWKNELSHGMQYQDTHAWMIDKHTFIKRFKSNRRLFVIMSRDEYALLQKKYPSIKSHVIIKNTNNVLIKNR